MKSKKSCANFLISVMFFSLMACAFSFAWQRESGFKDRGNLKMGNDKIQGSSSTGLYFDTNGDNVTDITFSTNNVISGAVISSSSGTFTNLKTTYLTVTSSATLAGNVGIDSASPGQKLDVVGSGKFSTSVITPQVNAVDSNGLKLYDDATNGIFVQDGGNIGIGTTSAGCKLDVNGNILHVGSKSSQISGAEYLFIGQNSTVTGSVDANCAFIALEHKAPSGSSRVRFGFQFRQTSDLAANLYGDFLAGTKNAGEDSTYITMSTNQNAGVASERVRIDKFGNVGIATSVPASKLHVLGDIRTSSSVICSYGISATTGVFTGLVTYSTQTITPSTQQIIYTTDTIKANSSYVIVISSAGAVILSSNPQISTGGIPTGTYIEVVGASDTQTITLSNGNGLVLNSGNPCTLGLNDVIALRFNGTSWVERFRSNN